MLNQFLHTARLAVSDINNFLKTNAEICLDFMMRLDKQTVRLDDIKADVNASYNRIVAVAENMDFSSQELDPRFFLEENY
jgi:hypothetical protein